MGTRSSVGFDAALPPEERYRILGRIASGGMAEIYLARMRQPNGSEREIVLKRLMPELQSDQEFVQMFHDEANIAARLRHPNIVQIFELGELDGSLFIAMELLRGVNLRDLLARLHARGVALPIPIALRIMCGCLEALDYAHRFTDPAGKKLNVVHRDVSPQNIIVTYDGLTKLVDFGVAKAEGRLHQTRAGLIKGKFAYMAPEQVSGGKVDGRSDIFALSEVFYEILLKRHPFFAASDMEVLRAILDKDPPHPSALDGSFPPSLGEVLMRAMKKAPGDRFSTAGQMQDALERYLQEARTPATTAAVGDFISELFEDRLSLEQVAREHGDDDGLLQALTAGRAEEVAAQAHANPRRQAAPPAAIAHEDSAPHHQGARDRVVEIARGADPADGAAAPAFMAHSGYTNPGLNRRFTSQVRQLFDDPADAPPPRGFETKEDTDEGELPTMLGQLSARELAELRGEAEGFSPGVTVGPPSRGTGVQVSAADPSARAEPKITRTARPTAPPPLNPPPPAVTPRSRTVLQTGQETPPKRQTDVFGLIIFLTGLGALIGAVVYAIYLYTSSSGSATPLAALEITTTPPGASIVLDGADTGARTPYTFPNVAANVSHSIELKLEGYQACLKTLAPTANPRETITCELQR